jgi:hypothetical protein
VLFLYKLGQYMCLDNDLTVFLVLTPTSPFTGLHGALCMVIVFLPEACSFHVFSLLVSLLHLSCVMSGKPCCCAEQALLGTVLG